MQNHYLENEQILNWTARLFDTNGVVNIVLVNEGKRRAGKGRINYRPHVRVVAKDGSTLERLDNAIGSGRVRKFSGRHEEDESIYVWDLRSKNAMRLWIPRIQPMLTRMKMPAAWLMEILDISDVNRERNNQQPPDFLSHRRDLVYRNIRQFNDTDRVFLDLKTRGLGNP